MRRLLLILLIGWMLTRVTSLCFGQCGPAGCCPGPGAPGCYQNPYDFGGWHSAAPKSPNPQIPKSPKPAWRYEIPRGHYRSVVRIQTFDRRGSRSLGSGVAVRWAGRVVILTARHVVKDARKVWVRGRKGYHEARLLSTDPTWDVAALEPVNGSDFDAAKIAYRETGHPKAGDRLESCGFGANNRLAVNGGRFLGYRTTMRNRRQADWLVLSGHARQGDSGGPVFNSRGELVGVLWGSANGEVVATQCGRLHVFLRQAVPGAPGLRARTKTVVVQERKMTPIHQAGLFSGNREPLLNPNRQGILPNLCPSRRKPPEPAPNIVVDLQPIQGELQGIRRNTDLLLQQKQAEAEAPKVQGTHPAIMFLVIGGAVVLGFVIYFASQKGD